MVAAGPPDCLVRSKEANYSSVYRRCCCPLAFPFKSDVPPPSREAAASTLWLFGHQDGNTSDTFCSKPAGAALDAADELAVAVTRLSRRAAS